MKLAKRIAKYIFIAVAATFCIILTCNLVIKCSAAKYLSGNMKELPDVKVGVVLGTNPYVKGGSKNYYFFNRIDAAVELYQNGKIRNIIVSGDNAKDDYNEPMQMKKELKKRGVPDSAIYLDYAGFRTFDSMIRAHEVFGQDTFIVISQQFHNERAVYIARKYGLHAFGYNARDVDAWHGLKTQMREFFAKAKVFTDLLIGKKPHFLGKKVIIN